MRTIVDTHPLVWFLEGNPRLSPIARDLLSADESSLVVPSIVLAEVSYLYAKKRIVVSMPTVQTHIVNTEGCLIYPLDESVVERLPSTLNIHDGIIVATAMVFRDLLGEDVAILTKDEEITQSGLIKTIWQQ